MRYGRRERATHTERSIPFVRAVRLYEAAVIAANRSENTRRAYMLAIRGYRKWLGEQGVTHPTLDDLNAERLRGYLGWMRRQTVRGGRRYQSSTIFTRCIAVKIFAKWLVDERIIHGENPLRRVKNPKVAKKVSKPFTAAEARALLHAADASSLAARNRALLLLAFATGLRATELASLAVDRLDLEGCYLTVVGKGAKERTVGFDPVTAAALAHYMETRQSGSPIVFVSNKGLKMSGQTLYGVFARLGTAAGVKGARPHRARDTFATVYAATHKDDLLGLQQRLGHENVSMTILYAKQARALTAMEGASVVESLGLDNLPLR